MEESFRFEPLSGVSCPNALSTEMVKKLRRYSVVSAYSLGRHTVARSFQGYGLGGRLLAAALRNLASK